MGCVRTEVRLLGRHSGTTISSTQKTISILQAGAATRRVRPAAVCSIHTVVCNGVHALNVGIPAAGVRA